jgi:iron complex transport system substrate-binding protein
LSLLVVTPRLSAAPLEVVDDLGNSIRLESPARRILALYGAYNEIIAAMGMEDRLVGRTHADMEPPSIRTKPTIGTHMRPNVEMIIGLKPDLILQEAGRREAHLSVSQLKDHGFSVAVFHITDFENLFSVIERIGILADGADHAGSLVRVLRERLDRVHARVADAERKPSIFFEVRYPNLLGAGTKSIVNEVIERAGGVNCMTLDKKFVRTDMETLIACNPDFYVVQRGPMNVEPGNIGDRAHFGVLDAIKHGRVLTVDEQVYSRPGPRSVEAVEALSRFLHPELWRAQVQ